MVIRNMTDGDFPQVAELIKSVVPYWDVPPEYITERYNEIKANKNHTVLVADKDGEILGTVTLILCHAMGGNFLTVEDMVVLDKCHRQGVGRALMEQADVYAKENGCKYAILVSSGFRKGAHRFYEAMGYNDSVVGFRKLYV